MPSLFLLRAQRAASVWTRPNLPLSFLIPQNPKNVWHEPRLPSTADIRFSGALVVENERWLQQGCASDIRAELRARLRAAKVPFASDPWNYIFEDSGAVRHRETGGDDGGDSLDLRVRVLVTCKKKETASFMVKGGLSIPSRVFHPLIGVLGSTVPYGLRITSADRMRSYEVKTMHITTYNLSRTYLYRYKTLRTLRDLLEEREPVNVSSRTPKFYIRHYLDRAHDDKSVFRWRRILGASDASSDEDSDDSDVSEPPTAAREYPIGVFTRRPRRPRKVHRSEAAHALGAHVEWLIAQAHAQTQGRPLIDFPSWLRFADETIERRRWGALGRRDDYDGEMPPENEIRVNLRALLESRGKLKRALMRAEEEREAMEVEDDVQTSSDHARGSDDSEMDPAYDSDYIEDSSDDSSIVEPPDEPLDPEIVDFLRCLPQPLLSPDFKWQCEVQPCDFRVDLRDLTQDNLRSLEEAMVERKARKDGTLRLSGWPRWIHPNWHRPWPPPHLAKLQRMKEERQKKVIIHPEMLERMKAQ
ncbi:hypothetical protein K488DRAFT_71641 [Vararia minispora EC-137]|uniref:Uncharacterized protein n=1 Tax=Vararia minispora EC-137 TaxID=1314806 RepID=A0ACB8QHS9_9AGAM|nr:hypothetical protein K488DRAFT_71641 [Vararia minispora EC-137]